MAFYNVKQYDSRKTNANRRVFEIFLFDALYANGFTRLTHNCNTISWPIDGNRVLGAGLKPQGLISEEVSFANHKKASVTVSTAMPRQRLNEPIAGALSAI